MSEALPNATTVVTKLDKTVSVSLLHSCEEKTLDELLVILCNFGKPIVHKLDDGWWCRVSMYVSAAGTTFHVGSELNCETPRLAVTQCAFRIKVVLTQWAR